MSHERLPYVEGGDSEDSGKCRGMSDECIASAATTGVHPLWEEKQEKKGAPQGVLD